MDILKAVLDHLIPIVFSGLAILVGKILHNTKMGKDLEDAIVALAKRVLDKAAEWIKISVVPDADGKIRITKEEFSKLRQSGWELLKEELNGPLAKLLLVWGEERVKGLLGLALSKLGVTVKA